MSTYFAASLAADWISESVCAMSVSLNELRSLSFCFLFWVIISVTALQLRLSSMSLDNQEDILSPSSDSRAQKYNFMTRVQNFTNAIALPVFGI